jgi:2-polyprenyl-3-methyl-5-hydroxy-6-metoxy-1,4-benzoquinol methylase
MGGGAAGSDGWNRNTHYHDRLLAALPADCRCALDVGCGLGAFARRLARVAEHVDALDREPTVLAQAARLSRDVQNVCFVEADFLTWEPATTYDAVSMIAVLHHLPFRSALLKAAALLRPGGVLIVLGLDRSSSLSHYLAANTVATLMSLCYATLRHSSPVGAPIAEPQMTLRQIRDECAPLLPGARIQRHALRRYSLLWVKPAST